MLDRPEPIRFPVEAPPEQGEAIEIAEGVLWMRLPLPMRLDHVNVYALDEGDGWAIVDTGFDTSLTREVWGALLSGPLGGRPVRRVFATHHHPDHIGLAGWFQVQGAELLATRVAWLTARMLTLDEQATPPEEALAFYRGAGMRADLYEARRTTRPFNFADIVAPLPLGYTRVVEGSEIALGGRRWSVSFGHGHAPEHAVLWGLDDDLVLAGDQIIPGISSNLGVHPTEPEADPVGEWLASCRALKAHARTGQLALPGHKLPFHGVAARLDQLIENHEGALTRLLEHLGEPRTAGDCFGPLFSRRIGDGEYGLALSETIGHLNHLHRAGRVSREQGADGAWLWRAV
ncbi:MAG: MBL fold metallo-hydrolase [Pseudomonadota bacterium]